MSENSCHLGQINKLRGLKFSNNETHVVLCSSEMISRYPTASKIDGNEVFTPYGSAYKPRC